MRMLSENWLDQGIFKELLTHALCLMFCERMPMTPESPQNMKGQRVRSSCRARVLAETKKNYQNLADLQWVVAQRGNQAIRLVMDWLRRRKDRQLDLGPVHETPSPRC